MTPAVLAAREAGIEHRVIEYSHAQGHAQGGAQGGGSFGLEAADALGVDPRLVFKTLIAELASGDLVVGVIPVAARLDLKALAAAAGSKKAAMADPRAAERATGYVVGGISPLGQRRRLATVLDQSALEHSPIYVSGGRRGVEIALDPRDLLGLTDGTVAAIAR